MTEITTADDDDDDLPFDDEPLTVKDWIEIIGDDIDEAAGSGSAISLTDANATMTVGAATPPILAIQPGITGNGGPVTLVATGAGAGAKVGAPHWVGAAAKP